MDVPRTRVARHAASHVVAAVRRVRRRLHRRRRPFVRPRRVGQMHRPSDFHRPNNGRMRRAGVRGRRFRIRAHASSVVHSHTRAGKRYWTNLARRPPVMRTPKIRASFTVVSGLRTDGRPRPTGLPGRRGENDPAQMQQDLRRSRVHRRRPRRAGQVQRSVPRTKYSTLQRSPFNRRVFFERSRRVSQVVSFRFLIPTNVFLSPVIVTPANDWSIRFRSRSVQFSLAKFRAAWPRLH